MDAKEVELSRVQQRLLKIFKESMGGSFSYEGMTKKTRSGMTKFQEHLRKQGIKEHEFGQPYDQEKYFETEHPHPWSCDDHTCAHSLLFPKELALKILALGYLP